MKITRGKRAKGRILSLLLSCCLLFGLVPGTAAMADSEGTDEGELVLDKWVEKAEDGFKLVLESYATGSNGTVTKEPVPLDIVLVLDESGSMGDVLIPGCDNKNGTDVEVTPSGHLAENAQLDNFLTMNTVLFVGHKVLRNDVDIDKTYTVVYPADGTTRKITYCSTCDAWYSNTNHADHKNIAKWIPFDNENENPTEKHTTDDWTCTVQFYEECGQTGRDVLQTALTNFLCTLYGASNPSTGEKVSNRVAIAGYGMGASYINSDGKRSTVYADPGDTLGGNPVSDADTLAENAWCNVTELEEISIKTWVNGVRAEGSTPTHLGIEAAELAFENAPDDGIQREKVMILFTDGAPGANYNNYGPDSAQYPDWVTPALASAKEMKNAGVTIYSVGLFPDADGYHAQEISYNVEANGNGKPADGFFGNANCFLHLVSSNYPNATGIDSRGELSGDYKEEEKSYYLGTSDATQLDEIFKQISEDVTPGSTTVTLDETAIVKDNITNDFQITYTDGSANVTAYTMSYQGEGKDWTKDEGSVSTVADINNPGKLHITVNGQTVSVTNFDFAENFVYMDEDGRPAGKKLVVEILIEPTNDTSGGTKLPTNATSTDRTENAGIYGPGTDTPVAEFPLPHVDLPTTVTIQKIVSGGESAEEFSFEAEYVQVGNYANVPAEESGGANDSNYLQLTEGTNQTLEFALANGGTQTLYNVQAGSTLTISENAAGWNATVTTTTSSGTQALTPDADGKYTVTVTPGMVITFTNTPESKVPGQTSVSVTKSWEDNNNQDGIRPDAITVKLLANGVDTGKTLTLSAGNNWMGSFTGLEESENGVKVQYTVAEVAVEGYDTVITGSAETGFIITNRHTPDPGQPDPTPSLTIVKKWVNDDPSIRPDSVTFIIYKDGEYYDEKTLTNRFFGDDDTWRISYNIEEREVDADWWVVEKDVPPHYQSYVIEKSENVFYVYNIYDEPIIDEPVSPDPEPSVPSEPSEPSEPSVGPSEPAIEPSEPTSEPVSEPEEAVRPTLPQTGQLWWPVPVLLAAGALLIVIAVVKSKWGGNHHGR